MVRRVTASGAHIEVVEATAPGFFVTHVVRNESWPVADWLSLRILPPSTRVPVPETRRAKDAETAPHKFEVMPGNKPGRPCNRCLERRSHPNHDPDAIREYRREESRNAKRRAGRASDILPVDCGGDAYTLAV